MNLEAFLDRLELVRPSAGGYVARCPAHDDRTPSLSITDGEDRILLNDHGGCDTIAILNAMNLTWGDIFYSNEAPLGKPVAEYVYTDEAGIVLYKVVRFAGKRFQPQHLANGIWIKGLTEDVRRVLYNLPLVIASQFLWIVEGEKDADALIARGIPATCNIGGAGPKKWLAVYVRYFRDKHVTICADKDEEGQGIKHAEYVAESLLGIASAITIVQAASGKDISDHIAAGLRPENMVPVRRVA